MFELIKKYHASIITYIGLVLFWFSNLILMWIMPALINGLYLSNNFDFDMRVTGNIFYVYSFLVMVVLPLCIVFLLVYDGYILGMRCRHV